MTRHSTARVAVVNRSNLSYYPLTYIRTHRFIAFIGEVGCRCVDQGVHLHCFVTTASDISPSMSDVISVAYSVK